MRPTKYTKELGEKLEDLMYKGLSIEEVCHELRICKQTLYNWCEKHPEFLDSKKRGEDWSKGWWMKQGRVNLENDDFSPTLFYMNMKNRFGWSDKQEVNQTTVQIQSVPMSKDEINDISNSLEDEY